VLDAVEGSSRRKEKDFFDMWHTVVFDLANCHIKLFTNIKALEYLQLLVGSNQDSSYRLGALIRIGNTHETDGDFIQAI
jgi:hypothetical protein